MKRPRYERRFIFFIELLTAVVLLGMLNAMAWRRYSESQEKALKAADLANVWEINSAIALYRFRWTGKCPGQPGEATFAAFLVDRVYFPDGPPKDPRTITTTPYEQTYDSARCRALRRKQVGTVTVDHETGEGH